MEITGFGGILGLIILILDILAIVKVVTSNRSIGYKLAWCLIILFLPLIGLILYAILG